MGICHDILIFPFIKLLRGIDKVNITIGAVLFENDNRRWNTGIKEDIGMMKFTVNYLTKIDKFC